MGNRMPGSVDADQCPFCNAPWGDCVHVILLMEWEAEALLREAQAELGGGASANDPLLPDLWPPVAPVRSAESSGN